MRKFKKYIPNIGTHTFTLEMELTHVHSYMCVDVLIDVEDINYTKTAAYLSGAPEDCYPADEDLDYSLVKAEPYFESPEDILLDFDGKLSIQHVVDLFWKNEAYYLDKLHTEIQQYAEEYDFTPDEP